METPTKGNFTWAKVLSKRGLALCSLVTVAALVALVVSISGVLAVHDDGVFEIDGNVTDDGGAGEDWQTLFTSCAPAPLGAPATGGSALQAKCFEDPERKTLFTLGSKDILDISSDWHCTNQSAPDKDEIVNAFAALYVDDNDHRLLYMGLDRFANNGDAQLGFWFFRNRIGADCSKGAGNFTGDHAVGDLLVLSNFVNGGGASEIEVHEVTSLNPLVLTMVVPPTTGANLSCNSTDIACGATNGGVTPSLLPTFNDKGPTGAGSYANVELGEAGIDLTALGLGDVCFNSFLAETRASQSITAELKDFVLGEFPICGTKSGKKLADGVPASGWTINLYRDNGTAPGALDGSDTFLDSRVTDTNGEYIFIDLQPGNYIVCEVLQSGWHQSSPTTGADCSSGVNLGPTGYAFTITGGEDHTANDFGNVQLFLEVVITCNQVSKKLVVSTDTVSGDLGGVKDTVDSPSSTSSGTTKLSIPPASALATKGVTADELEEFLCRDLAGARYENLTRGTYLNSVQIPK